MINPRWLLAIPMCWRRCVRSRRQAPATVRDEAGMFSRDAVKKAQAQLERIERATHIPIVIETIDRFRDSTRDASETEKRKAIDALAVRRDKAIRDEGIYFLISKNDHLISNVLVRERLATLLPIEKRDAIRDAFIEEFKKDNFDGGLIQRCETIEQALEGRLSRAGASSGPGACQCRCIEPPARRARGGHSTMGTFLLIILGIFGVLLFLRLLGGLFGRSAGRATRPDGRNGNAPAGHGPGRPRLLRWTAGYGGGEGRLLLGHAGGLGGALAGNWLYDQFSGRHGGMSTRRMRVFSRLRVGSARSRG